MDKKIFIVLAIAIIAIGIVFVLMPAFAQKKDSFDNGLKALNDVWGKKGIDPVTEPIIDGDATNQLTVEDLQDIQKQLQNFNVAGYENSEQVGAIRDSYLSLVNIMILEDEIDRLEERQTFSANDCPVDKTLVAKEESLFLQLVSEIKKLDYSISKVGKETVDILGLGVESEYLHDEFVENEIRSDFDSLKKDCGF